MRHRIDGTVLVVYSKSTFYTFTQFSRFFFLFSALHAKNVKKHVSTTYRVCSTQTLVEIYSTKSIVSVSLVILSVMFIR